MKNELRSGAAYIRVSTHMQDELSPDAQKRLLLDYAKSNQILMSEEYIYMEKGISGKKADKRPEFMRMISAAKQKPAPFDVILVWKFSRFARNQEESIVYKSLLRKQCGIEVISVSEPIIEGPFGSLIERIIEWMDEYYSVRLSGEVTRGMTEKALRGGYQARPPLGYRIPSHKATPVIIPEEAKIVQIIFDRYVNAHMSIFDIARYLNTLGYKTSRNKPFERRSIEYILQNPTYCGMIRWNRTVNETNEIRPKDEWIITEGHHEAIISKELFDLAQARYSSEYAPKGTRPSSSYRHWLSGLVKCPACGRTMIAKHTKDKRYGKSYCYFTCYGYSKGKCLAKNSISSLKLEPVILEAIKAAMQDQNLAFEKVAPQQLKTDFSELEILQDQLQKISAKEKRIKEAYRNGIDTLEEYKENKLLLQKERDTLNQRIQELTLVNSEPKNSTPVMLNRIQNVYEVLVSDAFTDQQKSDALHSIISKIVYDKSLDQVDIYYYYG